MENIQDQEEKMVDGVEWRWIRKETDGHLRLGNESCTIFGLKIWNVMKFITVNKFVK